MSCRATGGEPEPHPLPCEDVPELARIVHALRHEFDKLIALREELRDLSKDVKRLAETPKVEIFIKFEIEGDYVEGDKRAGSSIRGDNYGPVAVGATQTIGSIQQNMGAPQHSPAAEAVAHALEQLAKAIEGSREIRSERERKRLLEDIDELTQQAALASEAQVKADIGAIVDRLAGVCGAAGGLVTVWQAASPAIMAFFGL